eukprot:6691583-Lingulodinium_polyedra.AAC.1
MTQEDPSDGEPWDINDERKAEQAEGWIRECKPLLVIGSPAGSALDQVRRIDFSRMTEEDVKEVVEHGTRHQEFCMKLHQIQNW